MRIRIVQSGGFAGLRREKVVETAGLPAPERAALERLVETSGFFALPARNAAAAGGAGAAGAHRDARQFDVEIEDAAGRRHAVRLSEHTTGGALKDLVDRVWATGGGAPES